MGCHSVQLQLLPQILVYQRPCRAIRAVRKPDQLCWASQAWPHLHTMSLGYAAKVQCQLYLPDCCVLSQACHQAGCMLQQANRLMLTSGLLRWSTRALLCVDLPLLSTPSNNMNAPRCPIWAAGPVAVVRNLFSLQHTSQSMAKPDVSTAIAGVRAGVVRKAGAILPRPFTCSFVHTGNRQAGVQQNSAKYLYWPAPGHAGTVPLEMRQAVASESRLP